MKTEVLGRTDVSWLMKPLMREQGFCCVLNAAERANANSISVPLKWAFHPLPVYSSSRPHFCLSSFCLENKGVVTGNERADKKHVSTHSRSISDSKHTHTHRWTGVTAGFNGDTYRHSSTSQQNHRRRPSNNLMSLISVPQKMRRQREDSS